MTHVPQTFRYRRARAVWLRELWTRALRRPRAGLSRRQLLLAVRVRLRRLLLRARIPLRLLRRLRLRVWLRLSVRLWRPSLLLVPLPPVRLRQLLGFGLGRAVAVLRPRLEPLGQLVRLAVLLRRLASRPRLGWPPPRPRPEPRPRSRSRPFPAAPEQRRRPQSHSPAVLRLDALADAHARRAPPDAAPDRRPEPQSGLSR